MRRAFCAVILGVVSVSSAAVSGGWSKPRRINHESAIIGHAHGQPRIATDGNGDWLVTWQWTRPVSPPYDCIRSTILSSHSTDNGATWSKELALSPDQDSPYNLETQPAAGSDTAGAFLAVWASPYFLPGIGVARASNGGSDWSAPAGLAPSFFPYPLNHWEPEVMACEPARWLAAWSSSLCDDLHSYLVVSSSSDGGKTWAVPEIVLDPPPSTSVLTWDEGPRMATDGKGNCVLVFSRLNLRHKTVPIAEDRDAMVIRSANGGTDWSAAANISAGEEAQVPNRSPVVATNRLGVWLAAWSRTDWPSASRGIKISRSLDNGGTWAAPVTLRAEPEDPNGVDIDPEMATDGKGNWVAVWCASRQSTTPESTSSSIYFTVSSDEGLTWRQPAMLSRRPPSQSRRNIDPAIAADGNGSWVCAWASNDKPGALPGEGMNILSSTMRIPVDSDLAVSKSATPGTVIVGNQIKYALTITNDGPAPATHVIATDNLPPGVQFTGATVGTGAIRETGGTVTWSVGTVAPGAAYAAYVNVLTRESGTIINTVQVTGRQADPDTSNNMTSVSCTVNRLPSADLALGVSDSPDPVAVGSQLQYQVVVTNNGRDTAAGAKVSAMLPAGVSFVRSSPTQGTVNVSGGLLTWAIGNLSSGAVAGATLTVTPLSAGPLTTVFNVQSPTADPVAANSSVTVDVMVVPPPAADLSIQLTGYSSPARLGTDAICSVQVMNAGPSPATAVTVAGVMPSGLQVIQATATQGTAVVSGDTLNWTVGSLAVGAKAVLTLKVTAYQAGRHAFALALKGAESDPDATDDRATFDITFIRTGSDLTGTWNRINVTHGIGSHPGTMIDTLFTARNIGTSDGPSQVVRVYVSADRALDAGDIPVGYQRLGPIKSGKSRPYALRYSSPPGANWAGMHLIAFVDSDLEIDEMNEQNNIVVSNPIP